MHNHTIDRATTHTTDATCPTPSPCSPRAKCASRDNDRYLAWGWVRWTNSIGCDAPRPGYGPWGRNVAYVYSTDHVNDVHRIVAGVGEQQEAGGGGAREGHPARGTSNLNPHGGRRGGAPQGAHKRQAGTCTGTCTGTTAGQGKHTHGVAAAVGDHQQTQGGARRQTKAEPTLLGVSTSRGTRASSPTPRGSVSDDILHTDNFLPRSAFNASRLQARCLVAAVCMAPSLHPKRPELTAKFRFRQAKIRVTV